MRDDSLIYIQPTGHGYDESVNNSFQPTLKWQWTGKFMGLELQFGIYSATVWYLINF